ncbi:metallophosphoesterase family protein [Dictyobacter arantiisoli]|uniref:Calcineurin-like phosphoesterase domain-containing protein n=1 Tax=Dictyobacter arantiisoli TaxID=2014874 RepID=A0A5A5TIB4_9CHLR|nr:metallophosphoesterase family protein [Dictyobacter arantiisoli]GCF10704.1 hypothetical protein KDI_42680 [Dictyobacter arantiisoli]
MGRSAPIYIVGDIHGHVRVLQRLLQEVYLINAQQHWTGGTATLWLLGDLVDRGPDSIGVIDLVMRLQTEAAVVGGMVDCLLGNHEILMLGAYQFGRRSTGLSSNFITKWRRNGGAKADLAKLTMQHLNWLNERPVMAQIDDTLLIHADSTFYTRYGHSINEVNETFHALLKRSNTLAWEELIESFSMRGVFIHQYSGGEFIDRFTQIFGGERIIHGHTPISTMLGGLAKKVTQPYIYASGRCINVDGGIYMGSNGFVYQMPISQAEP